MMKMMIFAVAMMAVAAGLTACNTVNGVGQDISGGARTVQGWFH